MKELSISEKIAVLKKYQSNHYVHPLTCGNNSNHNILEPFEENGKVILKCPDCEYVQEVGTLKDSFISLADYEYPFTPEFKKLIEKYNKQ